MVHRWLWKSIPYGQVRRACGCRRANGYWARFEQLESGRSQITELRMSWRRRSSLLCLCCLVSGSVVPTLRAEPEALRHTLRPPPGFEIELVASEPLVEDPVAFDWDREGRLWVVEMLDYPLGLDNQGKPGGRVKILEDRDGDGRYDHSTLFLDGLLFPTSVMTWREGALVACAPRHLLR